MANLTIALDEHLIQLAQMRATHEGTSLSAKVREFLQQYVNTPENNLQKQRQNAAKQWLAMVENAAAQTRPMLSITPAGKTLRDNLYGDSIRPQL